MKSHDEGKAALADWIRADRMRELVNRWEDECWRSTPDEESGLRHCQRELEEAISEHAMRDALDPLSEPVVAGRPSWWQLRKMIMDTADNSAGKPYEHRSAEAEALANWIEQQYGAQPLPGAQGETGNPARVLPPAPDRPDRRVYRVVTPSPNGSGARDGSGGVLRGEFRAKADADAFAAALDSAPPEAGLREAVELVRAWPCVQGCDNGAIPVQVGDGEWEPQQCQFCDERQRVLAALRAEIDLPREDP